MSFRKKFIILYCLLWALAPAPLMAEYQETLTIEEAVDIAMAENPVIRAYAHIIESARFGAKSARAEFFPEASANYGYTGLKETPIIKTPTGAYAAAHRHQYNWSVNVIQPLFTGFALSARHEEAKLEIDIRRLEKKQILLDLKKNVKSACYHLLLTQKLMTVAENEVAALQAHNKDARLFYDQELIPFNDLLRSEVALANAEQRLEESRARTAKAVTQLNRLLDRPINGAIQVVETKQTPHIVLDYDRYANQALLKRPLMQSIQLSLKTLGFAAQMAKSPMYPNVSLVGAYEQSGDAPLASDNDHTNSYNARISVMATWKFWDWGKAKADAAAVDHQINALAARIESLRHHIRQQVKSALLDCEVAEKNIPTAGKALTQARENYRITNLQYQQQMATSTDVLDAQTYLTQADSNYYNALYGYFIATAELNRVVATDLVLKSEN